MSMITGMIGQLVGTISTFQSQQQQVEIAKAEEESIKQAAQYEETQARRKLGQQMAAGRAVTAASGVEPGTGTPLLLELDNARQAELEALNIRRTGTVQAMYKEQEWKGVRRQLPWTVLSFSGGGGSVMANWAAQNGNSWNWRGSGISSPRTAGMYSSGGAGGYSSGGE